MENFGRRQALGLGLAAVAGSSFHPAFAATGTLKAVITYKGQSYTYDESTGRDMGDFVSDIGGFTQRCIRSEVAALPLTVFFRPDRNTDRVEVVFELGRLFNGTPVNFDAYTVVISRAGQVLANVSVPAHYWFSRWRWQSTPRPVVGNIGTLISQGLLPNYDRAGVVNDTASVPPAAPAPSAPAPSAPAPSAPAPSAPAPAAPAPSAPAAAGGLVPGGSMSGVLSAAGQNVSLPLQLQANQSYNFHLDQGASLLFLAVRDSAGNNRAINYGPGGLMADLAFRPPATGSYSLVIAALSLATSYKVTMSGPAPVAAPAAAPAAAPVAAPTAAQPVAAPLSTAAVVFAPMTLAGVQAYMPQTGERDDIGLLTEPQAEYVCTGSATALATARSQAEAAGTAPWHMRDENTGAPIDFNTYPKATWYSDPRTGSPYVKTIDCPVTLDSAHMPALAYLPYLLTGDPYHLEDLQFQATWNWGTLPPAYRPSIPQSRTFAWNLRTLAQCARITPTTTPSWLLPRNYWLQMLTQTRQYFEAEYVNSMRPERARFRACCNIEAARDEVNAPGGTWVDPWQDDFVSTVLGWVVTMGHTEWRTSFEWSVGSAIARLGTTSGWVRAIGSPYRMILRETKTSPYADSWARAWQLTQLVAKVTYADPNTWVGNDLTYLTYARGALVFAQRLNTANVGSSITWADQQITSHKWKLAYKWRLLAS